MRMTVGEQWLRGALVATVLLHCIVTLWHGATHVQVPVPLTAIQIALVVATLALPLIGAGLLWSAYQRAAAWLIAVSMLGSLLFGFLYHFVIPGTSDYVLAVPATTGRYAFIFSAALLVVIQTLGTAIGVMAALTWTHQRK